MKTPKRQRQRGITIIVFATMLLFLLIPVVGLVVDVGVLYTVKARLQTAVDGAALAAGRGLSRSANTGQQQAAATDTAKRWYKANLPNGYMGITDTTRPDPTVTFPTPPAPRTILVQVDGAVQVPTYFMRILNVTSTTVRATGQSSRRFVNIMMVLDRSGSIYRTGSCGTLAASASQFVNSFVSGSAGVQQDRMGLVTFGTNYRVDFAPSFDFNDSTMHPGGTTLTAMVNNIYCYGFTNAAAAYWTAYQELALLGDAGALNVILFFTDGQPNTMTFGMAPGGVDNSLPVKSLVTPSDTYGASNQAKSLCKDSFYRTSASPLWAPSNFTGVLAGIPEANATHGPFKKDAATYPISIATDAIKLTSANSENNYGGCNFDTTFATAGYYTGGSPSRQIAGPTVLPYMDIAYLPAGDIMGNPTGTSWPGGGSPVYPVSRLSSSASWPAAYRNQIALDSVTVENAGKNAMDNAAKRARVDAITRGLALVTHTIGLGTGASGPDAPLLERLANDKDSISYDPTYPAGLAVIASDAASLNTAFQAIAAEVLRLSR